MRRWSDAWVFLYEKAKSYGVLWRQRSRAARAALALVALLLLVGSVGAVVAGVSGGSRPNGPPLPAGDLAAGLAGKYGAGAIAAHSAGAAGSAGARASAEHPMAAPPSRYETPRHNARAGSARLAAPVPAEGASPASDGPSSSSRVPASQAKPSSGAAPQAKPSSGTAPQAKPSSGGRTEAQGYRNRPPVPGISNTPSKREPYWACPHTLCEAIIVPHPHARVAGRWIPVTGGPAYEGSGQFGAFSPKDLESAYNAFATQKEDKEDPELERKQTIGIVDEGPYPNAEKDLNEYRKDYGLPECTHAGADPCFKHINQSGQEGPFGPEEAGVETPLDLDMASAGCPNCHILLVSANSSQMTDLGAAARKAAEEGATQISTSWGFAEQNLSAELNAVLTSDWHPKEGVMNYAAAGDGGYLGYLYGQHSLWTPASEPDVISVGATALRRAENPRGWNETPWSATGSGCSLFQAKPAWQLQQACPYRADNDVSAVGALETPVSVYFNGEWWLVAGTSAASPLVAGIEAHASEFARSLPGADAFYSDPAAFNEVIEGSDAPHGECELAILCNAGPGWNGPAGVGTPSGPMTITSLPVLVDTSPASSVSGTAATLNGVLDPQGNEASYHFEYGTSTFYGSATASSSASGSASVPATQALTVLAANTTYHYRLVASHGGESVYGQDSVFRTAAPSVTAVAPDVGAAGGDTSVTISGTNFAGVTAVKFGSKPAKSFRVSSESSITASSPPGSGTVDVTVTTPWGTTATSAADRFHYERLLWQNGELTSPSEGPWNLALNGVSCASSAWCMAVGEHENEVYPGQHLPDAQVWSGGKWTVQPLAEPGGTAANLSEPLGTAVDSHGDVWVTDDRHSRLVEYSSSGVFVRAIGWGVKDGKSEAEVCTETCQPGIAGSGAGQFKGPWGVAVAPNGDIWVVDSENHRLQEFTPEGAYVRQVTSSGMSEGEYTAKRMTVDKEGNLWVSEPGTGQVQELSETGTVLKAITGLHIPTGIAIDGSGNIWVAEESYNRLDEYSSAGTFIRTTGWGVKDGNSEPETCSENCLPGIAGTGKGQFDVPKSVVVDESGDVWVISDVVNGTVQEFKPEASEVKLLRVFTNYGYGQGMAVTKGMLYIDDSRFSIVDGYPITASEEAPAFGRFTIPADSALNGVSCSAQNSCMAVGGFKERSLHEEPGNNEENRPHAQMAERWNGRQWAIQSLPPITGATRSELNGISCVSASECVAVGDFEEASGKMVPYAALWRNGTWTAQSPPEPSEAGTHTYLSRVSCAASNFCMAVGTKREERDATGEGYGRTFAEVWNGTSWALTPTPELTNWYAHLNGVTCTSSNMCLAVGGNYMNTGEGFQDLVLRWNGKEWSQEAAPRVGANQNEWLGVSCSTTESCTMVGEYELHYGGPWVDGVESWNGQSWKSQTTAAAAGAEASSLDEVSCAGEAGCAAVGINRGFYSKQRAETRAENTLAIQATPLEAESSHGVLAGSSCVSSTTCIAVGAYDKKGATTPVGLAEEWNGFSWSATAHAPPNPSGGTSIELHHVSCEANGTGSGGSHATCTAVGSYKNSSGTIVTLAERWNGTEWKVQTTPNPSGARESQLTGVSCISATSCSAVGFYRTSTAASGDRTLAEAWNGTEWKLQTSENPAGATKVQLAGVSCSAASACTAVGSDTNSAGTVVTLAERLSGSEWKAQTTRNPSGTKGTELSDVSCASASSCTAVGNYTNSAGNSTSLAESWNGSEWQLQALEAPEGATQSKLKGVSCDVLGGCTAVGYSKQGSANATPLGEHWSGLEWKPLAIPSPSAEGGELLDVSCVMVDACEAAGSYTNAAKVQVPLAEGIDAPGASTGPAKEVGHFGATLTGSVQQNGWFTSYHFEYGETTAYGTSVPVENVGLFSESGVNEVAQAISGLTQGKTYHFRLVATSEGGTTDGQDQTFSTVATPTPGASSGPATGISYHTATLSGTVTPNDWPTTYYFEYGPTESFGSKVPVPEATVKSETSAEEVKVNLAGLAQNKTYYYRLVANNDGTFAHGESKTFTTAAIPVPSATTGSASAITWDAATLSGSVTPNHWPTTYYFEYGQTTAYGNKFPVPEAAVKSETEVEQVHELVPHLAPNTTYHYRLVAANEEPEARGEDRTFTTAPAAITPTFNSAFGSHGSGNGQLSGAHGDAVDSNGNVWVADYGNNRIEQFSSSGEYLGQFGSEGTGNGQFKGPDDVKVASNGDLWVADNGNSRLEEFSPKGEYLSQFQSQGGSPSSLAIAPNGDIWVGVCGCGSGRVDEYTASGQHLREITGIGGPAGVAVDASGNVWVTAIDADVVQEFTESGKELRKLEHGFSWPTFIAVDANGDVWVSDYLNSRVQEFTANGEYITQFGSEGGLGNPQGIAVAGGWAYVVDEGNSRVEKWDVGVPKYTSSFGSQGSGNGQLSAAHGDAVDSNGNVWVADFGNNRIEQFSSSGEYLSQFGSEGTGNGQFKGPDDVKVASNGDLWVADNGNSRLEEFTPQGEYLAQFGVQEEPSALAIAPNGDIWVAMFGRSYLDEYTPSGKQLVQLKTLTGPAGVAVDASGDVWVTDIDADVVQEFTEAGKELRKIGTEGGGSANGQFFWPTFISIDAAGNVWVSDYLNNRVQEFTSNGEYITQFGAEGGLTYPQGIAVAGGFAYAVNGGNSIEKWALPE